MSKELKCNWNLVGEDPPYYETECGHSIDEDDSNAIGPIYCPYCGNEILGDD